MCCTGPQRSLKARSTQIHGTGQLAGLEMKHEVSHGQAMHGAAWGMPRVTHQLPSLRQRLIALSHSTVLCGAQV